MEEVPTFIEGCRTMEGRFSPGRLQVTGVMVYTVCGWCLWLSSVSAVRQHKIVSSQSVRAEEE